MCEQAQLSRSDLVDMYSDWQSGNSKKPQTAAGAKQRVTSSEDPSGDDDQNPPSGAGGGNGGGVAVRHEGGEASNGRTAGGQIVSGSRGMDMHGTANGASNSHSPAAACANGSACNVQSEPRHATLARVAEESNEPVLGSCYSVARASTSDKGTGAIVSTGDGGLMLLGTGGTVRGSRHSGMRRTVQQVCGLLTPRIKPYCSMMPHSAAPQRATAAAAMAEGSLRARSSPCMHAAMQVQGSWDSIHATKQNVPYTHAASLLAMGGKSMNCMLHKSLKKSFSAAKLSSDSFPGSVGMKLSGVRSLRACNPEKVRRRHRALSACPYGSCCGCIGQINRTNRWLLVASMTHAACARVTVLHRAPRLRCSYQSVRCLAPFRLLKL
jgi:hypothetical protein